MRTKKIETIQCPYCNTEYLPVEIFNPKSFFGKPECIIRESGKIEDIVGSSMDLKESYICDNCNNKFTVTAKISFTSKLEDDFVEEHVTKLRDRLNFLED